MTAFAGIALIVAATAALPLWVRAALTLMALALLLESFGRDVLWLIVRRRDLTTRVEAGHRRRGVSS